MNIAAWKQFKHGILEGSFSNYALAVKYGVTKLLKSYRLPFPGLACQELRSRYSAPTTRKESTILRSVKKMRSWDKTLPPKLGRPATDRGYSPEQKLREK